MLTFGRQAQSKYKEYLDEHSRKQAENKNKKSEAEKESRIELLSIKMSSMADPESKLKELKYTI